MAAVGDVIVILTFAAIGLLSHHHRLDNPTLEVGGTAAPFLIGWGLGAVTGGAYSRQGLDGSRRSLIFVARSWILGGLVALAIRSAIERRIVPFSFVIVALGFNLVCLLVWRFLYGLVVSTPKGSNQTDKNDA